MIRRAVVATFAAALALSLVPAPAVAAAKPSLAPPRGKVQRAVIGDPVLATLDPAQVSGFFTPGAAYPVPGSTRESGTVRPIHVRVIGAYAINEPKGARVVGMGGPGYMPVTLKFSDGRCFVLSASYVGELLSSGGLGQIACPPRSTDPEDWPVSRPSDSSLRLIGTSWGYSAWADRTRGQVTVAVPNNFTFIPLFTTPMRVLAMTAMNSPDAPIGDLTLVGTLNGRMSVVTLAVSW